MDILSLLDRKNYKECLVCGKIIKKDEFSFDFHKFGVCINCESLLPFISPETEFYEKNSSITQFGSVFFYENPVQNIITDFKFMGCSHYSDLLAEYMYRWAYGTFLKDKMPDIILPVPMRQDKIMERGYNQSELLSEALGKRFSIPHIPKALIKIRDTKIQSTLTADKRYDNIKDAFSADRNIVNGKSVLLIDDIYTTGNTVRECARTLSRAGCENVIAFTLARRGIKKKAAKK